MKINYPENEKFMSKLVQYEIFFNLIEVEQTQSAFSFFFFYIIYLLWKVFDTT